MSGRSRWWFWPVPVLGISWLTGHLLLAAPSAWFHTLATEPADWLLPVVAAIVLLGYLVSRVAAVLGPSSLRSLLPAQQARWIAGLLAALVCVTWTGLLWSNYLENVVGMIFWQLFAGASIDIFVLGWICLSFRAAVSPVPARCGLILLTGALSSLATSYACLVALIDAYFRFGWEPNLALIGLVVFLLTGLFLMPPVLAVSGVAALFTSLAGPREEKSPPSD